MRFLVTGGAGYVGSVVAAALLERGDEVHVLDDLSTGHADGVPSGATFHKLPITRAGDVLGTAAFDGVLHFAAKSLVAESVDKPDLYFHNNVVGTVALLDALVEHRVPRIVFSSTAATYGEPDTVPITEDSPARPTNPYGASKLAIDLALSSYAPAFGFGAVSLRYFNVAGAAFGLGERHTTETHLIPITLQVASGARDVLSVYGTDYPTDDGTCVRDYVHVADLADAHLRALDAARNGEHLIVNLGSGRGYSVREVVDTVSRVTGRGVPTADHDRRPGDPAVLIASNARAADLLGWSPTRGLDDMVADAWEFSQR